MTKGLRVLVDTATFDQEFDTIDWSITSADPDISFNASDNMQLLNHDDQNKYENRAARLASGVKLNGNNEIIVRFRMRINRASGNNGSFWVFLNSDGETDNSPACFFRVMTINSNKLRLWVSYNESDGTEHFVNSVSDGDISVSNFTWIYYKIVYSNTANTTITLGTEYDASDIYSKSTTEMIGFIEDVEYNYITVTMSQDTGNASAEIEYVDVVEDTSNRTDFSDNGSFANVSFNRPLSKMGNATVDMVATAGSNDLDLWLNNRLRQSVRIETDEGEILWRGNIIDIKITERNKIRFVARQKTEKLFTEEAQTNYNVEGPRTITARDATTISDSEASFASYSSSEHALLLTPAAAAAFTVKSAVTLNTDVVTGIQVGDASSTVSDDENFAQISVPSQAEKYLEIVGNATSIGRSNIQGMEIEVVSQVKEVVGSSVDMTLRIYNYTTPAWEDLQTITYGAGLLAWQGKWNPRGEKTSNDYVESGTGEFKLRIAIQVPDIPAVTTILKLWYLQVKFFTDPLFQGEFFPITSSTATVLTVSSDPTTNGVDVGDGYVVGKRHDLVLAELMGEHNFDMTTAIDSGMTNYTAGKFATNHKTTIAAIRHIMDKEEGYWYYRDNDNTIVFVKKDNLVDQTGLFHFNFDSGSLDAKIISIDNVARKQYKGAEVTGAAFKNQDSETRVFASTRVTSNYTNAILRHSDDDVLSDSEALKMAKTLLTRANTTEPAFLIEYNVITTGLFPGALVKITYEGTAYTLPIRNIAYSWKGHNTLTQTLDVGWQGTPLVEQMSDKINDLERRLRKTEQAINLRTSGVISGVVTSHNHDHSNLIGGDLTLTAGTEPVGEAVGTIYYDSSIQRFKGLNDSGAYKQIIQDGDPVGIMADDDATRLGVDANTAVSVATKVLHTQMVGPTGITPHITTLSSDSDPDLDGVNALVTTSVLNARTDANTTVGLTAEDSTHNALHVAISDGGAISVISNAVSDSSPNMDDSANTGALHTHALLSARKDATTTIGITATDGTQNALHTQLSDGTDLSEIETMAGGGFTIANRKGLWVQSLVHTARTDSASLSGVLEVDDNTNRNLNVRIREGSDTLDLETLSDNLHDIDGKVAAVVAAQLYARQDDNTVSGIRAMIADADARSASLRVLLTGSFNYVFNGTTWDRSIGGSAYDNIDDTLGVQFNASVMHAEDDDVGAGNSEPLHIMAATSDSVPDLDGVKLLATHSLLSARSDANTTIGLTALNSTHNALHVAISDGTTVVGVDAVSGNLKTISQGHHQVHEENHYTASNEITVSAATYYNFKAPNTSTRIHFAYTVSTNDEALVQLYENPTITSNGSGLLEWNNDRNSANTPEAVAFEAATISADGTFLESFSLGASGAGASGGSGGIVSRDDEIILDQNVFYIVKITPVNASTVVTCTFSWYEK